MKEMTAKEAARNFSAMLTAVENGETVLVTRSGRRIATIVPAPRGNLRALKELFSEWSADELLDDTFEANVATARSTAAAAEDSDPWND